MTTSGANHFELFALSPCFEVDSATLAARYRQLQAECHPDRFASATSQERLAAVQQAARVNEAHATLKDPLKRAFYLLELRGVCVDNEQQTTADGMFLMQQMELREQLEDAPAAADPLAALDTLALEIKAQEQQYLQAFAEHYEADENDAALETLKKLQFFIRLKNQLGEMQARIEDELLG